MDKEFAKALKADQADLKNSDYNVGAGSIMAAKFLESFVNKTPWAHLDIAGTAWSSKASPYFHKGATGFGIRLLYQWILDNYTDEKK
jgi:leucyl aminopeptidase